MIHRFRGPIVALITFVTLLITSAVLEAQTGLLRARIVDQDKNPIPGVQVTVTSAEVASYNKRLVTKKKGDFTLRFTGNQLASAYTLLFEKPGFQSFSIDITPSAMQDMREEWVMEPGETQVIEKHGDLGSVVSGSSNTAVTAFNTGLAAEQAGDLASARAEYEKALAEDPNLAPAQLALANALLNLGEHEAAVAAADRALELPISRADGLRIKYQSLRALGRSGEADALAAELEAADGAVATARVRYNEGGEAFQAGDKETALAKFQEAAELDPSLTDAHHAIGTILFAKGDHAGAAAAAEQSLAMGSDDVRTLRVLYDAYDALGKMDELVEIAPRLAAVDPDFGGPKLIEQAAALWNAGQADKAVSVSQLALSMDPNLAKAYYFIGLDHLSGGRNAEAKAALGKFIEMAPDDSEAGTAREMIGYIE